MDRNNGLTKTCVRVIIVMLLVAASRHPRTGPPTRTPPLSLVRGYFFMARLYFALKTRLLFYKNLTRRSVILFKELLLQGNPT